MKKGRRKDYLKHKKDVRNLVLSRIEYWRSLYNFRINRIAIRNQKSRWGSCSRKGNLNFNYQIIKLPHHLMDYIIVHELCHLSEFNHSKAFWDLVAKAMPNYRELRKELRKGILDSISFQH